MKLTVYFLTGLLLFNSCKQKTADETAAESVSAEQSLINEEMAVASEIKTDTSIHYKYSVFPVSPNEINADNGFGFEISSSQTGGMKIRQESIPAVQGIHPFMSEENAAAVAQLMIYKLNHGIVPPAVSTEELDSLGVVY